MLDYQNVIYFIFFENLMIVKIIIRLSTDI